MARCIQNETSGRSIFYGAMNATLANGDPAAVVHEVSTSLFGDVGGLLAVLGVIILPMTSGDTAFRSTRLILADFFKMPQQALPKHLLIATPSLSLGF